FERTSATPIFDPREHSITLTEFDVARLDSLALKSSSDLPALLLACWQVLVFRVNDAAENTIGVAFDGRKYDDLQETPGPLTRFLPVQSELDWDAPFERLVGHASESMREAHKWQEFFGPEQSFPIAFEYHEVPRPILAANTRFAFIKQDSCADRFKIKLTCAK